MPKNPHRSGTTMIVDGYDPVNLFQMVPKLQLEFEPELARLDELLDDDQLFNLVKADLLRRHPNSGRVGRHSTPVEVILRMLIVKRLYGWSYAQTERFVNDSIVLRQFTRLYLERSPDDTTLIRWANTIGSQTVASLNDRAVQLARSLKVTRGRKLRIDGTVVETNIHHPTDDTLISDGVRVIGRLLTGAKSFVEESVLSEHKGKPFRNRTRSAKRLAHKISKMALRRSQEAKADLRAAYERLLEVGKATLKQAGQVQDLLGESPSARKVAEEISRFSELLEWAVGQARRRVLEGEHLEAQEKLLSLFEEHTVVIRRGKARKQTEFGRKVWLSEVDGGIVSGFSILEGNAADEAQLKPSLEDHLRLFEKPPELVAADRNVHSKDNERLAKGFGVKKVCLPKSGKKSALREQYEGQGWYKRARRFRAGIEGRISVMKRRQYLSRCRDKGEEGFGRWVGWGVLMANLDTIAQTLAAR
jgi:IS5 family transposase